jgi:hypothetical protein
MIEVITSKDVKAQIDAFCETHHAMLPDFSFAHIALSDYNLADGHIDFCLDLNQILPWFYARVRDHKFFVNEQAAISETVGEVNVIVEFLNYLKTIPEPIREGVLDLDD